MSAIPGHSRWTNLAFNDDFDFLKLSFDDLRLLFVDTSKLKQVPAYTEEHFDEVGNYSVEGENNNNGILRCIIQICYSYSMVYKS